PEIAGANVPERWRGWRLGRRPRFRCSGKRKDVKVAATVSALFGRSVLISLVPLVDEADVATVDELESTIKSARDRKRWKFTIIVGSSPKVSGACREFVGSSLKVTGACREFNGSSLRVIGGLLGVRRKLTEGLAFRGMVNPLRERHHEDKLILHGVKDEESFEAHTPYLRKAFDKGTKVIQLAKAKLESEDLSTGQEDVEAGMVRVTGELDYFSAHIRLREPGKSEDKAEERTSMESSIPCSHGGRALVVKGAEEVENAEANSKY
ncbi:hypothetical protein B296_00048445, partial [Ensete ventricosum]